jgi:hypothetical protein
MVTMSYRTKERIKSEIVAILMQKDSSSKYISDSLLRDKVSKKQKYRITITPSRINAILKEMRNDGILTMVYTPSNTSNLWRINYESSKDKDIQL